MSKNLVIVESPAKAKTIERYLGKDYMVKSSFGHIRDLPKKSLNVDKANDFTPNYEIPSDKKMVVSELKKLAKDKTIWLASDEDREGEAIAWHLCQALGLDIKKTNRIVFHEITESAIKNAIKTPRRVNEHLVDAQQARRVLDRLVGYELSPVLWKKVRPGLSAGRVQSVAVRLIVEREREIKSHQADSSFRVIGQFDSGNQVLEAELNHRPTKEEDCVAILSAAINDGYTVESLETKPSQRNPSPPFTTSTLQQEAARRLGFGVKQTMVVAQKLYESGFITYMRTDSTNIAASALASSADYIEKTYGKDYLRTKRYVTKSSGAQEAHEAIRPTNVAQTSPTTDKGQAKLYQLIWQRFLASQMAPATTDKTEISLLGDSNSHTFNAKGEVLKFPGYLKVYGGGKEDVLLPKLEIGQKLSIKELTATETFTRAPARYSEAGLVKKLEEMGIGRPSTYAPTISTIQDRGYVEKQDLEGAEREVRILTTKPLQEVTKTIEKVLSGADRSKLMPTSTADVTTDFLVKHFAPIVDYAFTADAEKEFDNIEAGKVKWNTMIANFYNKDFLPLVEKSESVSRKETSQQRRIGSDPQTGRPVYARYGRFGPMLQIGDTDDQNKPQFAPLPEGASLDSVTIEQALEMFKLPRMVGSTKDGQTITANIGRFGPYIKVGSLFVSIKPHDPFNIDEQTARELYQEKIEAAEKQTIQDFGDIKVLNGRFGPYVTDGKKNAKIPKTIDPAKLTEAEARELIKTASAAKRPFKRKTKKK